MIGKESKECTAEPEKELASLLNHGDNPNKFSSELKRFNEESEERITQRIIQRVTIDNERVMKRLNEESEERILKQVTVDNELTIKRITECIKKELEIHKAD